MPTWWELALGFCLPSMCLSCQMPLTHRGCCIDCTQALPWLGACCQRCAIPISVAGLCGHCLASPPAFHAAVIPFAYAAPIDHWLGALKFYQQLEYAAFFADCLWQTLQTRYDSCEWPELILPVPLHRQRLQWRGYNQALLIATSLANLTGIALARQAVIKTRATPAQTALSKSRRQNSLKRVFTVVQPLRVAHVALVDDVLTTGATVQELAKTVLKAGVQRVDVWCVARTTLDPIPY